VQLDTVALSDIDGKPLPLLLNPKAARQARIAWSSNAVGAPNTAMTPSPVNLSTVPIAFHRCRAPVGEVGHDLAQPLRTHRSRDIHRMHHIGEQNSDLLVLRVGIGVVDW
jgi:hypothetical protein